jgi:hypothetical protein
MFDTATLAADAASALEAVANATVTWAPSAGGASLSAPVMYDTEAVDAFGQISTGQRMRYATALLPGLADGEVVSIGSNNFRVAEVRAIGDGLHSGATLHRYITPTA